MPGSIKISFFAQLWDSYAGEQELREGWSSSRAWNYNKKEGISIGEELGKREGKERKSGI